MFRQGSEGGNHQPTQFGKQETSLLQSVSQEFMSQFKQLLRQEVGYAGNNLHPELRRFCLISRVLLEKPELLLIHEECLEFGAGLEKNLQILMEELSRTTILAITKNNSLLAYYDKIMLIDAGHLQSGGNARDQLASVESNFYKYLHETDPGALSLLLRKSGLV
jgi:ABC-type transport system involved in cytochrome bd biosynthesis fused ATPase/permease subunit